LIVLRKKSKIRNEEIYEIEYRNWRNEKDMLSMDSRGLITGNKMLFIDDIMQTTNSVLAAKALVERTSNTISRIVLVANLSKQDSIGNISIESVIKL
jgi:adenine/guanine phosphoribosyltransferase-like PRPP-binding protein